MHTQLGSPHTPHKPLLGNSLAAFPDSNEQPAALVIRPGQRHTRLLMGFFGCCGGSAHATQPADTAAKPRRHHRRHRRQRVPPHKPADGVPDAYAHSVLSGGLICPVGLQGMSAIMHMAILHLLASEASVTGCSRPSAKAYVTTAPLQTCSHETHPSNSIRHTTLPNRRG